MSGLSAVTGANGKHWGGTCEIKRDIG